MSQIPGTQLPPPPPDRPGIPPRSSLGSSLILIAGGALIALGSFLPWTTVSAVFVGTVSSSGIQGGGDGIFTVVLGIALVLIGVMVAVGSRNSKGLSIVAGLLTVPTLLIAILDYSEAHDRVTHLTAETSLATASVGAGLWTVIVGTALAILGALVLLGQRATRKGMSKGPSGQWP